MHLIEILGRDNQYAHIGVFCPDTLIQEFTRFQVRFFILQVLTPCHHDVQYDDIVFRQMLQILDHFIRPKKGMTGMHLKFDKGLQVFADKSIVLE